MVQRGVVSAAVERAGAEAFDRPIASGKARQTKSQEAAAAAYRAGAAMVRWAFSPHRALAHRQENPDSSSARRDLEGHRSSDAAWAARLPSGEDAGKIPQEASRCSQQARSAESFGTA